MMMSKRNERTRRRSGSGRRRRRCDEESGVSKLLNTIGALLLLFLVAVPKDLWRWFRQRRKCVRGQTVVITGGASGLGKRLAELFAAPESLGARVAIIDKNIKAAECVAEAIQRDTNGLASARAWHCDVADAQAVRAVADDVRREFGGRVDVVVCNAAILHFALCMDLSDDELRRAVDINVLGTINTIRAFLPPMIAENRGHVVAIASIAAHFGETFGLAYCPTKFAVRGAMDCLRMELLDRRLTGVRCTTICPFFIRTPMIMEKGIRPKSRWVPFMSIDSAAQMVVDAILKEKVVAFVPPWISVFPLLHSFFSLNMQRIARDWLDFRYEQPEDDAVAGDAGETDDDEGDDEVPPYSATVDPNHQIKWASSAHQKGDAKNAVFPAEEKTTLEPASFCWLARSPPAQKPPRQRPEAATGVRASADAANRRSNTAGTEWEYMGGPAAAAYRLLLLQQQQQQQQHNGEPPLNNDEQQQRDQQLVADEQPPAPPSEFTHAASLCTPLSSSASPSNASTPRHSISAPATGASSLSGNAADASGGDESRTKMRRHHRPNHPPCDEDAATTTAASSAGADDQPHRNGGGAAVAGGARPPPPPPLSTSAASATANRISRMARAHEWFRVAHPLWWALIPPAMLLALLAWASPEWAHVRALCFVGDFAFYMGSEFPLLMLAINVAAWLAHFAEAVYALWMCDEMHLGQVSALKWFLQTFALGYPSLRLLLQRHRRHKERQK